MKLTLFTTPKSFQGHFEVIQRNAIRSWTLLNPACEVILFGNDKGTAEIAIEFGLRHIPNLACNEYGTPLISHMFEVTQRIAEFDLICYLNADIILMSDFLLAVEKIAHLNQPFLLTGQRWHVDLNELLNFDANWEEELRACITSHGQLDTTMGLDYFVFPKKFHIDMPPFAIGRPAWDNWLIYHARSQNIPVIDATPMIMAVHQKHDYTHRKVGTKNVLDGPEAKQNIELAPPQALIYGILDATYTLTPKGPKRVFKTWHLRRYLHTWLISYPLLRPLLQMLLRMIDYSYKIRSKFGLANLKFEY